MSKQEITRLKRILEATAEGWWEWDTEKNVTYRSPHWYRMLGLPVQKEASNISIWIDRIHPDDRTYALRYQEECIQSDKPWELDFRMKHTEGHYVCIRSRGRVLKRDKKTKNPLLAAGTHVDVTRQREMEDRLKKQLAFLDDLSYENSHNFRSAVANIMGIVQLLREESVVWENVTVLKYLESTVSRLDEAVWQLNNKIDRFIHPGGYDNKSS